MKNYMIIKQEVSDLATFQRAFDRLKAKRAEAGLTDLGQFCAANEPDTVIVLLEVADISLVESYWHSATLTKGRVEAGVVGPVEAKIDQVWLTDGLVKDRVQRLHEAARLSEWHRD
jgi:hypothetical protein